MQLQSVMLQFGKMVLRTILFIKEMLGHEICGLKIVDLNDFGLVVVYTYNIYIYIFP